MAILGEQGYLRLRRDAPPAVFATVDSLSTNSKTFDIDGQEFWSGDEVYVFGERGIPISPDAVPEGTGVYVGGKWDTGRNREHIANDEDKFWLAAGETAPGPPAGGDANGDAAWFYANGDAITSGTFFVYIDQLGRIALYPDRRSAMAGERDNRQPLFLLDFGMLAIAPSGTLDYDNAVAECISTASRNPPDAIDSGTLASICDFAPTYDQPAASKVEYQNADIRPRNRIDTLFPWEFICEMKAWNLETNGDAVDTTSVGTKWGENTKSLVTGGGTIDFMVDRLYKDQGSTDATALMRLLLMTEKGCQASAQFFFILNRQSQACLGELPGDLYYEAEIFITNIALNVRPDELVLGTAAFVTTGPIALRAGPN